MFDFINKHEYFDWGERDIPLGADKGLKGAQDAFILSLLRGKSGLKILEMGGGDSRLLRVLCADNECWNIDKFDGGDGGPKGEVKIDRVQNVIGHMGGASSMLPDRYFDYVVSVSVMEHVPKNKLYDVFRDCWRVLEAGGTMAHAIDVYLLDPDQQSHPHQAAVNDRLRAYQQLAEEAGFELVEAAVPFESPSYRCSYVSHPDALMFNWNRRAPGLKPLREIAQAASLKTMWRKSP